MQGGDAQRAAGGAGQYPEYLFAFQASCHSLGRKGSKLDVGVPSWPRAARLKKPCKTLADAGAIVNAAAVAEAPRVDLIPKPVTSVLQDLSRFHGLPSLGE